jgi:hypothetical protein
MNLSDTFYIALCMTVLILGVVYWFWTQNQFMLRKINLLENIVYEMKAMLPQSGTDSPGDELQPTEYPPAPSSVLGEDEDLLHEELHTEVESLPMDKAPSPMRFVDSVEDIAPVVTSPVVNEPMAVANTTVLPPVPDDLQPGGVGSGPVVKESTGMLESMTLKELRRLAEQRGITGASTMRKQQLIDALKAEVPKATVNPFESNEGILELN